MSTMTGSELKKLRESQGTTLERAAADTCLRLGFLRELEEVTDYDSIPETYQKLSFLMYARYLGMETETTRRAAPAEPKKAPFRIVPMTNFVRRMGRPPAPPRLDRRQRNRLLTIAKTTSVLVVAVLAIGLYSLNAKLARINLDDVPETHSVHRPAPAETKPQSPLGCLPLPEAARISLEDETPILLAPIQGDTPEEMTATTDATAAPDTAGE